MAEVLRPTSEEERETIEAPAARQIRANRGVIGRLGRVLGIGALGISGAVAPDVVPALFYREPFVQTDSFRMVIAGSLLANGIPSGAPREVYVLANVAEEAGRVFLRSRPELISITSEDLVNDSVVEIGGERFWLQAIRVKGGGLYYFLRRQHGAVCVASDTEGGESGAVASLDKVAGDFKRQLGIGGEQIAAL